MTPRRRLELSVLGFGAVFLAVILFSFRPGKRPSSGGPKEALPGVPPAAEAGQATTVLKGFDYTETVRGKPLFRIQAERTVGFGAAAGTVPNMYALEKVALTVYPEQGGAAVTVHADRAQYDRRSNDAHLSGNVRWLDERGALGETEKIQFRPSARRLVAPAAVHFTRGTFDVKAKGAIYDLDKRELALEGPVSGSGTGEGSGGLSEIAAGSGVYRRDEGVIELAGKVSGASREGDRIACDRMTLKTEPDGKRFEWARADGSVSGILSASHPAAGKPGAQRRYSANQGSLLFAPDGAVRSLALSGSPATVEEAGRTVSAGAIDVSFAAGRPTSASARENVVLTAGERRVEAQRASLSFAPSGEIGMIELTGGVRTQEKGRSARAEKAVEVVERGLWILTGEGSGSATVESGGSRVSASRIEIEEKNRGLRAEGNARAVFVRETGREKAPTLVGDPARPTFGKAQRMVFDDANGVVTLSGGATLWQDSSSLFGDDITLNDAERTLVAVEHTRTVLSGSAPAAGGPADRRLTVVTARRVVYREAQGTAVFDGGVTVTRGAWRGSGQTATASLDRDRKVERVEMAGEVSLADQAAGRTGGASRAVDIPREGKTILYGSPAWVVDAEGNRVSGAVLTISDRGRSVEVTAPEGGRTETIHKTRSQ